MTSIRVRFRQLFSGTAHEEALIEYRDQVASDEKRLQART